MAIFKDLTPVDGVKTDKIEQLLKETTNVEKNIAQARKKLLDVFSNFFQQPNLINQMLIQQKKKISYSKKI